MPARPARSRWDASSASIGVPMVLAPVFGPVTGGLLVEHVGWRWIFFVNLPVGIAAVCARAGSCLPAGRARRRPARSTALGLVARSRPACRRSPTASPKAGSGAGFASPQALVPIADRRPADRLLRRSTRCGSSNPLLNVRLYANRAFAAASATTFCLGAVALRRHDPAAALLPGRPRRRPSSRTGLLLVPQSLGAAFAMPLRRQAGRPLRRRPDRARRRDRHGALDAAARFRRRPPRPYWLIEACAARPRPRDRARDDAGDERRLRGAAAGADRRRDAAADGRAARRRLDRHRRPRRRARHGARPAPRRPRRESADAFSSAYWWALGLTLAAIVPAVILLRAERDSPPRSTSPRSDQAATEAALEAA